MYCERTETHLKSCTVVHVCAFTVLLTYRRVCVVREPDMELVLPGGNEAQVDGLVKVGKDIIG